MHILTFTLFIFISVTWAEDLYNVLGVRRTADQRDIRKAFKKIAMIEHPHEKPEDVEAYDNFLKLITAYEVLKDPDLREKYDLLGDISGVDRTAYQKYNSFAYYQNDFGIYDDDPRIITLNKHDFENERVDSEKMWLINYCLVQCSQCRQLANILKNLAKDLEEIISIGIINCDDDMNLCTEVGIQAYPTLMLYPPHAKQGRKYYNSLDYERVKKYILDNLDSLEDIKEIDTSVFKYLLEVKESRSKPTLVFICGENHVCFTRDKMLRVAATFENTIDVKLLNCNDDNCDDISSSENVIYLFLQRSGSYDHVAFENILEVQDLVKKVLKLLPEPRNINDDEFTKIMADMKKEADDSWLIFFHDIHVTNFDSSFKQLSGLLPHVNLGKLNCDQYPMLCTTWNINHYPTWGVLKRESGAFEQSHGEHTLTEVARFAENSLKAKNVWSLISSDKINSILNGRSGNWFLSWCVSWSSSCTSYFHEVRQASLEFGTSVLNFGIIDCATHPKICKENNVRHYPTAMYISRADRRYNLVNGNLAPMIAEFIISSMNSDKNDKSNAADRRSDSDKAEL